MGRPQWTVTTRRGLYERLYLRVVPRPGVLVDVVLAEQLAEGDDQSRRIRGLAMREELHNVVVEVGDR